MLPKIDRTKRIIYLTGYGFEDRTVAVAQYLLNGNEDKKKLFDVSFSFGDPSSELGKTKKWKENKFFLDEFLSVCSGKYEIIATTVKKPLEILLEFRKALDRNEINVSECFTIIDITSFPKTTLLAIFSELLARHANGLIYYVEPENYELPFSIGVKYYGLLPFFGSNYSETKKRILWVILGFEGHRAYSAWNNVEPDETVAFIGKPFSTNASWEQVSKKENDLLLSSAKVREDTISFVDIKESEAKLEKIYDEYRMENIVIAPLGTKLSTIPVAYFARNKNNVFVVFSSAERETEHQSIGSKTLIQYAFNSLDVGESKRIPLKEAVHSK